MIPEKAGATLRRPADVQSLTGERRIFSEKDKRRNSMRKSLPLAHGLFLNETRTVPMRNGGRFRLLESWDAGESLGVKQKARSAMWLQALARQQWLVNLKRRNPQKSGSDSEPS